jgi:hypothetical protein
MLLNETREIITSPVFEGVVAIVSGVATLAGLVLAVRARANEKQVGVKLHSVSDSLTTRPLGESPAFGAEVAALVRRARKSLQITAAIPTIGAHSAPDVWLQLEHALKDCQARGVKVDLLTATRNARRRVLATSIAEWDGGNWRAWSERPEHREKLASFARRYRRRTERFATRAEFVEFSLQVLDEITAATYWDTPPQYTNDFISFSCWVRDNSEEAVFAFVNEKGRNSGFVTRDRSLIQAFTEARNRYSLGTTP